MGFGVPGGIGVAAATGRRPLILVGDGAFQMTGWELGNCRRYGFDPIVVLFNNASWEMLRVFQPESRFNDLSDWNFATIAASLGGHGERVTTRRALKEALERARREGWAPGAERAAQAERSQAEALERFQHVVSQVIPSEAVSESDMHLGQLSPVSTGTGGGFVLQLVSPTILDFSMVIVNGLDPAATELLPYRVRLVDVDGDELRAGRIDELDADGGAEVFHQFKRADLTGFTTVVVVDAIGDVVLSGTVDQSS